MKLSDIAEHSFARHETFHPRYSWFRKAYAHVAKDGGVFSREDATVRIGVGKNMVRSIRFWGLAAKLITADHSSPNSRSVDYVPTRRGEALFGKGRWDPYMEDPGTLWLLHWLLLAPKSQLPVWWLAFNRFEAVEFTETDLDNAISTQLDSSEWTKPHPKSISKDVSALLRTYAPVGKTGRVHLDDILDCPLRELNLLGRSPVTGRFRFTLGPKPTLPSEIVVYCALDYVALNRIRGNTITLSRLVHESGAPGKAFKFTESEMLEAMKPSLDAEETLGLATPTGAVQFTWSEDPAEIATKILDRYFKPDKTLTPKICAGPEGIKPIDDHQSVYDGSR